MYLKLMALGRCGGATLDIMKRHKRAGTFAHQENATLMHSHNLHEHLQPYDCKLKRAEEEGVLEFAMAPEAKRRRVDVQAFEHGLDGASNTMLLMMRERKKLLQKVAVEAHEPAEKKPEIPEVECDPCAAEFEQEKKVKTNSPAPSKKDEGPGELDEYVTFVNMMKDLSAKPWEVPEYLRNDKNLMKETGELLKDKNFLERDFDASPNFTAGHSTFTNWRESLCLQEATTSLKIGINGDTITTMGCESGTNTARAFATPDVRASNRKLSARLAPVVSWVQLALVTSPTRAHHILNTVFGVNGDVATLEEAYAQDVSADEYTFVAYLTLQFQLLYKPDVMFGMGEGVFSLRAGLASGCPGHSWATNISYLAVVTLYRMLVENEDRQRAFLKGAPGLTERQRLDLGAKENIAGLATFLDIHGFSLKTYEVTRCAGAAERSGHTLVPWAEAEAHLGGRCWSPAARSKASPSGLPSSTLSGWAG